MLESLDDLFVRHQQPAMNKVGNQTNSNDPQALNSRVFVGNLNTYQVAKEDVERMFKRYGRIAGISMHKGYAFIQYMNPYDARNAIVGEDGAVICGQQLDVNMVSEPKTHVEDVNMVSEPKTHQTGRKRQNLTNTGNDWDYYYDSYSVGHQRLNPPNKRARVATGGSQKKVKTSKSPKSSGKSSLNNSFSHINDVGSSEDILICGNCKETFSTLPTLADHKRSGCRLRFSCRCAEGRTGKENDNETNEPASFLCATCKDKFSSAWDLVHHVQSAHELNIYELPSVSDGGASGDETSTSTAGGNNVKDDGDEDDDMDKGKDSV